MRKKALIAALLAILLIISVFPQNLYASMGPTYDEAFNDFVEWVQKNGSFNRQDGSYQYNFSSGGTNYSILYYSDQRDGVFYFTCQTKWNNRYRVITNVDLSRNAIACNIRDQLQDSTGNVLIEDASFFDFSEFDENVALHYSVQNSGTQTQEMMREYQAYARMQAINTVLAIESPLKSAGHVLTDFGLNYYRAVETSQPEKTGYEKAFDDLGKWLQENGTANGAKNKYQYDFKTEDTTYSIVYSTSGSGNITITSQTKWQDIYNVITRVGLMGDNNACDAGAQLLDSAGKLIIADSVLKSTKDLSNHAPLFSQTSATLSEELNSEYLAYARKQVIRSLLVSEDYTKKAGHTLADYGFTLSDADLDNTTPVGFENFKAVNLYTTGQFSDVRSSDWFSKYVEWAYNYALMGGTRTDFFNADGNVTIAETITMASGMNSVYYTGAKSFDLSVPWYQTYVDYAIEHDIIKENQFTDYNKPATRTEFVTILSSAFPKDAFPAINSITVIPDVPKTMTSADRIYMFYNAGIISGSDKYGTFNPTSNIKRSEVAVILRNIVNVTARGKTTLEPKPIEVTSVNVTGLTSLSLYPGQTVTISASVLPTNATNKTLTYASSNPAVATVSASGVVSTLAKGTTTITIKASNGKYATVIVNVVSLPNLRIYSTAVGLDSVGGAKPRIAILNNSGKTIKYIYFTVTPYNAVGDAVSSQIGNKRTTTLSITGPIAPLTYENVLQNYSNYEYFDGKTTHGMIEKDEEGLYWREFPSSIDWTIEEYEKKYRIPANGYINFIDWYYWDPIWYNNTIRKIVISKVVIEYMDGTKETINNPPLMKQPL